MKRFFPLALSVATLGCGPRNAEEYVERALDRFNDQRYQESIECCTKAIDLDPTKVDAYTMRALAFTAAHRFESALADIDQAIELSNDSEEKAYLSTVRSEIHIVMGECRNATNIKKVGVK